MGLKQTLQMFQMKTTYNGRQHQMEDNLIDQKISQQLLVGSQGNVTKANFTNVSK
jgi:hypothetical protein